MDKKETVIVLPCENKRLFAIAFIYANVGNFVLKGDHRLIIEEISNNYRTSIYHILQGNRKKPRNKGGVTSSSRRWQFHPSTNLVMEMSLTQHRRLEYRVNYIRRNNFTGNLSKSLVTSFKRIPKKWLPEYDVIRSSEVR